MGLRGLKIRGGGRIPGWGDDDDDDDDYYYYYWTLNPEPHTVQGLGSRV